MTNETMKDGERESEAYYFFIPNEALEKMLRERESGSMTSMSWEELQKFRVDFEVPRAASPQSGEKGRCHVCAETKPHTGACGSKDPRALCNRAAAPQAALTDEQREAIEQGVGLLWGLGKHDAAKTLRSLLPQAPTERMSDAGRGDVK